ncbi:peptidase, U32 family [Collinsella intestinalis DSM 13280]|uniref:Peptidase, U32 family n=1 Tax=Collinsella intestinalis DSM 13280 TaxID=521003 RepID=C4F9Q1_9ACTN|nr:U32 family peptidase [Collinsella intestinalis]EEP44429.1 peptidase, U32 family [Collinsella intestinalis DSM 13280]
MVELLAPAGTPDALRAAIAAGADAVYVGLGSFNARAANGGFSLAELSSACVLAHAHGARVYVTLNVYVRDDELGDAVALAGSALAAGADALIVADMGLIARIRAALPDAELHLSTQAGAQCAAAVDFAARELGVERVTCARELSVAELAELCATGVEIEAFCHGAICICYSGACSYSALMRGRSANRGDCTQPCRLAYELQDGSGAVLAGGAWERGRAAEEQAMRPDGDRLLCPRDYLGIRHIAEMLEAGVSAFKIEGRMKSPDYVYNVVRCYREALDAALAGRTLGDIELDGLEACLARSFSRGFTSGYLEGGHAATGSDLMSVERAINQGLRVGHVVEPRYEGALVAFDCELAAGDMLEIRSTPGPDAPADVPKRWPIVPCPRDVASGEEVLIPCKRKVEAGSAVHVVRSASTILEVEAAVREMREEEVRLAAAESEGVAPGACLEASEAGAGREGIAASELGVDCASAEPARFAHVRRRRENGAVGEPGAGGACAVEPGTVEPGEGGACKSPHTAVDLGEVCRLEDLEGVRAACERVVRGEAPAVVVRNIGQIPTVRAAGVPWEVGSPLQVWNAETARVLVRLGARRVWLPEELTIKDLASVRAQMEDPALGDPATGDPVPEELASARMHCAGAAGASSAESAESPHAVEHHHPGDIVDIAADGSAPLMITEHCLLTAEGPCSNNCPTCPRRLASRTGDRFLVELDRKSSGARLTVRVDEKGRTRLYRM